MKKIKTILALTVYCVFLSPFALGSEAGEHTLRSPSGDIVVSIQHAKQLSWSVSFKGEKIIEPSNIDINIKESGWVLRKSRLVSSSTNEVEQVVEPLIRQKSSQIREAYRELSLRFDTHWGVDFRAYDDGVAYRLVSNIDKILTVNKELAEFNFPPKSTTLFPEEETFISHFERLYLPMKVKDIDKQRFASLPAYVKTASNVNVVLTEADLFDYPGLFLFGKKANGFIGGFPGALKSATPREGSEDRNQDVSYHSFIARTHGKRTYPWRLAVISDNAGDLVESELVYLLSRESEIKDGSWINPGRVAWDWYNANNIFGVDFESGINTATYKYYIDFAAQYGLEYVILDEGWSLSTRNVVAPNPDMDVHELIRYGKEKGVGIILWTLWKPLDDDYENILKTWAQWGVAGAKIDFMQRADQQMVNYYEKIAREAAKNKLLVNYHGGYKPAGLRRAFPNVVSYEGVKGNENNKWSHDITPEHNVTIPFIRMLAGPMDYTPGAMLNTLPGNHRISHFRPMSMGTRAHQVAMYAVYESPLQMLCDSPSAYLKEPEVTQFISAFPTVWDETKVLGGEVGEYILVARRSGDRWFLGAMTNGEGRTLFVDLSFLSGEKPYSMLALADGKNAERFAQDYILSESKVRKGEGLEIELSPGGGWSAQISPK